VTALGDGRRAVLLVILAVLVAATAFGLWHVMVGGLIHGNARAGLFGLVLTAVAGTLAAFATARLRRRGTT